jgi:hypothetical protein
MAWVRSGVHGSDFVWRRGRREMNAKGVIQSNAAAVNLQASPSKSGMVELLER